MESVASAKADSAKPAVWLVLNEIDRPETAIYGGLASRFNATVFMSRRASRDSRDFLLRSGADIVDFECRSRLDLKASGILREFVRRAPPDLIYSPLNKQLAACLRATRGTGIPVVGYRGTMGHISHWDPASWITYLQPRLSKIVCVSKGVQRYLTDELGVAPGRTTQIYKGHDPEWYAGKKPAEPGIPPAKDGEVTVSFAGKIRPVKGVEHLLDAMEMLPEDLKARLLLIGDVADRKIGRRISAMAGDRVIPMGFRADATALVGQTDIFVMPSVEREGLARAVIEAMSQSVPVIASDVGGLPELVLDGVNGITVPPRDGAALARAIEELARDKVKRAQYGAAGLARVREVFDYRLSISRFADLFSGLIAESRNVKGNA